MEIKFNHGEIIKVSKIDKIRSSSISASLMKQRAIWHRRNRRQRRIQTRALAFNSKFSIIISTEGRIYSEYHTNLESVNKRTEELWKLNSTAE